MSVAEGSGANQLCQGPSLPSWGRTDPASSISDPQQNPEDSDTPAQFQPISNKHAQEQTSNSSSLVRLVSQLGAPLASDAGGMKCHKKLLTIYFAAQTYKDSTQILLLL